MNIFEMVSRYQNEIQDNCVLIEYDLFFNNIPENYCRFSIDEHEELEELKNAITKIREKDKKAEIYVCTYGIDFTDVSKPIYGDILIIETIIDIKDLDIFFKENRRIEPSDIALLSEDQTLDGIIALVFSSDGTVEDYGAFVERKELCKIKRLYWD